MLQNRRIITLLLWLVAFATLLPIIAHLVIGIYNRPMWDDFCFALLARDYGVFGAAWQQYQTWTGAYTSTFLISVTGALRAWPILPHLLIVTWFSALAWLILPLLRLLLGERLPDAYRFPIAISLSAILLAVTLNGTVNVFQSVYWASGSLNYTLPLILFTFNFGLFVRVVQASTDGQLPRSYFLLTGLLCLIAGGASALFSVVQVLAWGLVALICAVTLPASHRRAALKAAIAALGFAMVSFIIVLLSPGNAIRRASFPEVMPFTQMVIDSVRFAVFFTLLSPFAPLTLVLGVLGGAGLFSIRRVKLSTRMMLMIIVLVMLVVFGIVTCGFLTGLYATTYTPPLRTRIVMHYTVILGAAVLGAAVGYALMQGFSSPRRTALVQRVTAVGLVVGILLLGFNLYQMTSRTLNYFVPLSTFADEWDTLTVEMTAADPDADIVIEPFTYDLRIPAAQGTVSEEVVENGCVQAYYRVRTITPLSETASLSSLAVHQTELRKNLL